MFSERQIGKAHKEDKNIHIFEPHILLERITALQFLSEDVEKCNIAQGILDLTKWSRLRAKLRDSGRCQCQNTVEQMSQDIAGAVV